ncbi:MAG: hypothetical protein K2H43_06945, partial [Clostridia bacterium]|nr:hypothetical protein [Clostridia bacterium]
TYSAPTEEERREIEDIRKRYTEKSDTEGKLERLRRLHRHVNRPPLAVSVTAGVVGTLIFGLGMTMVLEWHLIGWGIGVAAVGAGILALARFAHKALLKRNKKKYGDEILKLTEELLHDSQ